MVTRSRKPSTRKPTAERRTEIANATLEIIGRRGLTALTTNALADAVGVTSGALFRHFESRAAILEEAVCQAEAKVDATFPSADLPPLERLRRLAGRRIELLRTEPGIAWLLRSDQAFLTLPPSAVKRLQALVARSKAYIKRALEDARESKQIRSDVPLDVLMLTFTSTVHALIGKPGLQGRTTRSGEPDRAIAGLFHLFAP